ncbi:energy-coupling factor transporter transmembrane component T family protein [Paenibacillus koleovorans]|uniref:energy-coupling factor transporter transmembrane component T family protein n=1 Tax=Paenibacillus koleovorans TaxID=121608 RepID=UPI0013E3B024|nr:energy-coupling factor transporter transmembrane component T [Paenibacillus koleovorans]
MSSPAVQLNRTAVALAAAPAPAATPPKRRIDPRAAWVFCTLVSIGILLQGSLPGLAASAVVTLAAIAWSPVAFRTVWRAVLPLVWLTSFTVVFSGVEWIGFSFEAAGRTLLSMQRFLFIMAIGLLLPLQYSPLALKKALETSLAATARWKVPVTAIALYVSMLMRFIPIIKAEWLRFARIARARGGSRAKPGTVRARDLPVVAVPMLLSLFRMAEAAALAMEQRGFRDEALHRHPGAAASRFERADFAHMLGGVVIFLLLAALRVMIE